MNTNMTDRRKMPMPVVFAGVLLLWLCYIAAWLLCPGRYSRYFESGLTVCCVQFLCAALLIYCCHRRSMGVLRVFVLVLAFLYISIMIPWSMFVYSEWHSHTMAEMVVPLFFYPLFYSAPVAFLLLSVKHLLCKLVQRWKLRH